MEICTKGKFSRDILAYFKDIMHPDKVARANEKSRFITTMHKTSACLLVIYLCTYMYFKILRILARYCGIIRDNKDGQ